MTSSDLHNFADDNTIAAMGETIQDSVNILQDESEKANQMVGYQWYDSKSRKTWSYYLVKAELSSKGFFF